MKKLSTSLRRSPFGKDKILNQTYDHFRKKSNRKIDFGLAYDLQAFFTEHKELNASAIATRAGINGRLLRQYSSGVKHPSKEQAQKIEDAIHQLAEDLRAVSLYA